MKKVIALLAVCGFALAFVACGKKADETATEPAVETPAATDTAATAIDTANTAGDTAH
jgi:hypothetical protein